jgi:2-methylcitrate dehydratase PrpD
MTPTARLIDFASAEHRLPAGVRADAERLLADTLAVGAAGRGAPGEAAILGIARSFGAGREARLIGETERLPAASAAFVNGYRIHCLEWDAVHEGAVVHAMSVVTAALGAAIDRAGGCDADKALTALAVGVDIACGLGIAAEGGLKFFRPATAGIIGAAAAVARITGAPAGQALGLAYSSVAGTMQAHVEGSMTLPYQVANAARGAVVAADLARAGFTAPQDVFDGPYGYFRLVEEGRLATYTDTIGEVWRLSEISTKPYPSGRASHAVLSALPRGREPRAAGDVLRFPGLSPAREHVMRIEAHVTPLVARLVGRPYAPDMTPAYARLCLPLLVALMLSDGRIDPRRFTPTTFADPEIAKLAAKVQVLVNDNADPNALSPQRLVLAFADGQRDEISIPHTLGSPDAPLSPEQAGAKRELARELATELSDPRLFDSPLAYFTEPA